MTCKYIPLPLILVGTTLTSLGWPLWSKEGFESAITAFLGDIIVGPAPLGEFYLFLGLGPSSELKIKARLELILFPSSCAAVAVRVAETAALNRKLLPRDLASDACKLP